jgi:hypothetical protein
MVGVEAASHPQLALKSGRAAFCETAKSSSTCPNLARMWLQVSIELAALWAGFASTSAAEV